MTESLKQQHVKKIWQKAQKHAMATKVGVLDHTKQLKDNTCQCCDQFIHINQIPYSEHTKQFEIFGFGYPLYFSFLKYCILLVLILVASKTATLIYMATKENYDFCYGSLKAPELVMHHENPHHLAGLMEENVGYLGLRHFKGHNEDLNFELEHKWVPSRQSSLRHLSATTTTAGPTTSSVAHSDPHIVKLSTESLTPTNHPTTSATHPTTQATHPTKQASPHEESNSHQQPHQSDHSDSHSSHDHLSCTSFMVYFALFQGEQEYNSTFLRIVAFIIHLLALAWIRNNLMKQRKYYDQRTCSLSDYSIMVSNLPKVYGTGKMVRDLFSKQFQKTSQVKQLIYIFEDQKLQKYKKQLQQQEEEKLQALEKHDNKLHDEIQDTISTTKHHIKQHVKTLKGDIKRDYIHCDKIIVIMDTQQDKDDVLDKYKKQKDPDYSIYFQHSNLNTPSKGQIKLKQACEPNEIIWEHIDENDNKRKGYVFIGWVLTLLFLAVVTLVFYFIMLAKTNLFVSAMERQLHNPNDDLAKTKKIFATVIVFLTMFGVIMFNKFVMGLVLHFFVHHERHAYTDEESHSFAMKYSLGMFFTTALMTLAVEAIHFRNFVSHPYGVIEEETIMFFVTAFFIPFVWLIHPYNMYRRFQRWLKRDKLVTQKQANELIEDFHYDLGKRYAEIFEIMWFTFLYSELIPLGSFLILIGLALYYCIDKYNFLYRSVLKQGLSGKITVLSLKSLDATLFLAPAGRLVFIYELQAKIDLLSVVLTVIGVIYLFLPTTEILEYFNKERFNAEIRTYEEGKHLFNQHYTTLHPVYKLTHEEENKEFRNKGNEHWRQEMKKRDEEKKAAEKINPSNASKFK